MWLAFAVADLAAAAELSGLYYLPMKRDAAVQVDMHCAQTAVLHCSQAVLGYQRPVVLARQHRLPQHSSCC